MLKVFLAAMAVVAAAAPSAAAGDVPAYQIVADLKSYGGRIVDVRIAQRHEESELNAIATDLADREPRSYAHTTVNFIVAAARTGDTFWATTRLKREMHTAIAGLRPEEERQLRAEAAVDVRHRIGAWLATDAATAGLITLFRREGKTYLEQRLRGRATDEAEVAEISSTDERRFDVLTSQGRRYVVIRADGALEIYSGARLQAVAERIGEAPQIGSARASRHVRLEVRKWPDEDLRITAVADVEAMRPAPTTTGSLGIGVQTTRAATHVDAEAEPRTAQPRSRSAPARTPREAAPGRLDAYSFFYERNN
jgi:hypothetical protein